jgi:O-succinylhomoserine sulfhydrylase
VATASGMSAILSLVMALCSSGDHIVASTGLFGATQQLFGTLMPRFGIQTSFVAQTDAAAWGAAMRTGNQAVLSGNAVQSADRNRRYCRPGGDRARAGYLWSVDNCFCTPILQRPLDLGADLVVHSATKFLDGQGGSWAVPSPGRKADR